MKTRLLGNSDVQITPIIMGTWQAGKTDWVGIEDEQIIEALRAAFAHGITTFDTAEDYGNGYSEKMIGKALGKVRDRVVYASKVWCTHLKYDQVIAACDRSLKNLQTDYIDLYQIHWPAGSFGSEIVPIAETMAALNDLKAQGKIRAIGVSNFSRSQIAEAAQYGQIDSFQPPYSLFWRKIEAAEMPYCVENNITILAYSSLAQGLLTGKFGLDPKLLPGDNRIENKLFADHANYQRVQQALAQLRPIAEACHCTLAQLALAWLVAQPQTCAIAGARNAQQAIANAKAGELELSTDILDQIEASGRIVTDHLDSNPMMWNW